MKGIAMRARLLLLCLVPLVSCVAVTKEIREEQPERSARAFDILKSLAGKWHGTSTSGDKQFPVDVTYEVASGGTVVMERLFPASEHEMISMYHRDGAKLVMTHYCSGGNQPRMDLVGFGPLLHDSEKNQEFVLSFRYRDATNHVEPELVMHDMRLVTHDKNRFSSSWTAFVDGKADHTANFDFTRVH
ncbi:MAG TPA: hypothetical protein VM509_09905 [Planctomycetota bacterium]|nr:hypothetical protein [Planctomycetota bacterium]